jgi:predicted cobalt transporter CbtA
VSASYLRGWLARRYDGWNATLIAGAAFVVVIAIAIVLLLGINEGPERFPAVLLWKFRLASLGTEAVLWLTLGPVFGALTRRSFAQAR